MRAMMSEPHPYDETAGNWYDIPFYHAIIAEKERRAEAEARAILAETEPSSEGRYDGDVVAWWLGRDELFPVVPAEALAEALAAFVAEGE